jgi:hypothetical protein
MLGRFETLPESLKQRVGGKNIFAAADDNRVSISNKIDCLCRGEYF